MDRREFLLASGSAVLAGSALPISPLSAQTLQIAKKRLTLTVAGAGGISWTVGQARELASRIERASGNRYAVKVSEPASVKVAALKFMRADELVEIDRAFAFVAGLPGRTALDAAAVDTWLAVAGGQAVLDEVAAAHGLKVLIAGHGGEQFLWSVQRLRTASDFAGKCVQADGLSCHVAAGLGAEPWRIVNEAASGRLASGEVAAIEATIPDAIAQGLIRPAHYASTGALAPRGHAVALTIRLDVWNALSPVDQTVISTSARENYLESERMNRAHDAMNRQALQQTYAIDVSPVPLGLAASIETVARAVVAQVAASSPSAMKLNASYMSFLQSQQELTVHDCTV